MQQSSSAQDHIVVLAKGEDLIRTLNDLAVANRWPGAWIQSIGGAALLTLGFYNPNTKAYQWKTVTGQHEIVGLQGNLAWVEGKPFWHLHGTFSGADYQVIGGHVRDLLVGLTCEVRITVLETRLVRVFDDDTGLKLLHRRADSSLV